MAQFCPHSCWMTPNSSFRLSFLIYSWSTLSIFKCTWPSRINLKTFLEYDISYLSIWPFMRHPGFPTTKASKLTFSCCQFHLLNTMLRLNTVRAPYLFYTIFHCGLYCRVVYTAERLVFYDFFSSNQVATKCPKTNRFVNFTLHHTSYLCCTYHHPKYIVCTHTT